MSIANKLVTIAENEQKVFNAGRMKTFKEFESFNANVNGTTVAVNDVYNIEHDVGVKLKSKNLLNVKDRTVITYDGSGLNFVENAIYLNMARNGVYTYTQTSYDISNPQQLKFSCNSNAFGLNFSFKVKPNETYTLNCSNFDNTQHRMGVGYFTKDCVLISHFAIGEYPYLTAPVTFTTPANCYWMLVIVAASPNSTGQELTFENVQLELGTTATEYTPYVADVGGIEVSQLGKNLALAKDVYKGSFRYDVVEFEGRTAVMFIDSSETLWNGISFKPNTQYTVSFDARVAEHNPVTTENSGLFCFTYSDGQRSWIISKRNTEWEHFTLTSKAGKTVVSIGIASYNYQNKNYIDCNSFQFEEGSTATAYEPYNRTTYQSTADGTVEGVASISPNMTLLTNNNGVVINANYLRDIDTYIDNLITNVALTGGE